MLFQKWYSNSIKICIKHFQSGPISTSINAHNCGQVHFQSKTKSYFANLRTFIFKLYAYHLLTWCLANLATYNISFYLTWSRRLRQLFSSTGVHCPSVSSSIVAIEYLVFEPRPSTRKADIAKNGTWGKMHFLFWFITLTRKH